MESDTCDERENEPVNAHPVNSNVYSRQRNVLGSSAAGSSLSVPRQRRSASMSEGIGMG